MPLKYIYLPLSLLITAFCLPVIASPALPRSRQNWLNNNCMRGPALQSLILPPARSVKVIVPGTLPDDEHL